MWGRNIIDVCDDCEDELGDVNSDIDKVKVVKVNVTSVCIISTTHHASSVADTNMLFSVFFVDFSF